jgi:Bacterial Ig-like domain (group 3)
MRFARVKALLSMQRGHRRSLKRGAKLRRAAIDVLEPRLMLAAQTFHVLVALDNDNMGNPFVNSLRWAIGMANANPGSTIEFSNLTPVSAPIVLNADLSAIPITAAGTIIDGTTETPQHRVVIEGNVGGQFNGFDIQAANVTIKGLDLEGFGLNNMAPGAAITLDAGSSNDVIINNLFGQNSPNRDAIDVNNGSTGDTIGGTSAADRNIISGSNALGVNIEGAGTTGIVVEGNYIGTDTTGESANANSIGVELQDVTGNTIQKNLISGNSNQGILTTDPGGMNAEFGNSILNNMIGLDALDTKGVPNGSAGVQLQGGSPTASMSGGGEGDTVMGNTIEDNVGNGINIQQTLFATTPAAMYSGGMYNLIMSNTIISNGDSGIVVNRGSEANTISQNSISLNGITKGGGHDIGIDLSNLFGTNNPLSFNEDGVTADTTTSGTGVGASATGGNGLTPFPVLGPIVVDPSNSNMFKVNIELEGNPGPMGSGTEYQIELFSNLPTAVSSTGHGQGGTFLGSVPIITTMPNQFVTTSFDIPKALAGDFISATATDVSALNAEFNPAAGGTSEFSVNAQVPGNPIPSITIGNAQGNVGTSIMFPVTLSNLSAQTVSVNYSFTPGTAPTSDFGDVPGTLNIPPGTTQTTINVPAINDQSGVNEQFTITISNPVNGTLANLQSSESATGTIIPNAGTTASTTTLTATPNPVKHGFLVTFTATVAATGGSNTSTVPTGFVNFVLNGSIIGTSALNGSGQATFTSTTLPLGNDNVTAIYVGDATYASSSSFLGEADVDVVNQITTTITLSATTTTPAAGGSDLLTATITPGSAGPALTGTVEFFDGGTLLGTDANGILSDGQSFFLWTNFTLGSHSLTAQYLGDNRYNGSTSSPVNVTVSAAQFTSSTSLTATTGADVPATTVSLGDSVTLTATVIATSGVGPPTGGVSFSENGIQIGSANLVNGIATLVTTTLPSGIDEITANYSGGGGFGPSVSDPFAVNVTTNTTTTLTETAGLVFIGESASFTATIGFTEIDGVLPTGTVTFFEDGVALLSPVTLQSDGTAVLAVSPSVVGDHTITAVYSGDATYTTSTSAPVSQTVIASPNSVIAVTASKKLLAAVGDSVTLTATVSSAAAGGATPTGTVTFVDGAITLGSAPILSGGVALLTTTALVNGINTITATYNGNPSYTPSAPATVIVNVNGLGLLPTRTITGLTSAIAGTKIHANTTVTLMNPNATPTTGVGTLNLYASTDGTVDTTSTLIKTLVINTLNVKALKSINVNDMITAVPASLASGSYTLMALMMSPSGIVDFSSTGPSFAVVSPIVALSETLTTVNLGQSLVSGAATRGSVKLAVTNHGNIPSSGLTTFNITASPASGVVGTTVLSVTEKVTIPAGRSKTITIPIKSVPSLADGQYFLVTQVTDPRNGISVASSANAITIAAPFVSLAASFATGSSVLTSGATLIVTNNGNIDDVTELSALLGFSTDPAGSQPVPDVSTTVFTHLLHLKAGKSMSVRLSGWKSLVLGLTHGVQYFATATLTDQAGNSVLAVDSANPVSV